MSRPRLAVIGGTGLDALPGFEPASADASPGRYGRPSAPVGSGRLDGFPVAFLPRHGADHAIAPHLVNYRANIDALARAGCTDVLAVAAVGGIAPEAAPGALVVPDQIVDYTWGRAHTFADGVVHPLDHVDFTEPYSASMRARVLAAAGEAGVAVVDGGVYGATQGPRLESAAEIARMARDGCTLVGMTGMPEAGLAREAGLAYAHLALVVNAAAGLGNGPITLDEMRTHLEDGMHRAARIIRALAATHS